MKNWVIMQTLNASLSTTLTGTHFLVTRDQVSFFLFCLGMGDCFDSILQESFFLAIRMLEGTVLTGNPCSRF